VAGDETIGKILAGLLVGGGTFLLLRARQKATARKPPLRSGARAGAPRKARMTTNAPAGTPAGLAGGILLRNVQAGSFEAPSWIDVPLGDVIMQAATDNLRSSPDGSAPLVRLPVTWPETVDVAKALGAAIGEDIIAPSQKMVDALHAAAKIRTSFPSQGTSAMMALATSEAYSRNVDDQIAKAIAAGKGAVGDAVSGHEKYWLLHQRLDQAVNDGIIRAEGLPPTGPNPAVNYGAWDANGKLIQTVGGRHNAVHYDESQVFRAFKRWARKADGTKVDMLLWIESNEGVPSKFTDLFRPALVA